MFWWVDSVDCKGKYTEVDKACWWLQWLGYHNYLILKKSNRVNIWHCHYKNSDQVYKFCFGKSCKFSIPEVSLHTWLWIWKCCLESSFCRCFPYNLKILPLPFSTPWIVIHSIKEASSNTICSGNPFTSLAGIISYSFHCKWRRSCYSKGLVDTWTEIQHLSRALSGSDVFHMQQARVTETPPSIVRNKKKSHHSWDSSQHWHHKKISCCSSCFSPKLEMFNKQNFLKWVNR